MYNLTHWGRLAHICVCKPTIISSDNGLSPGRPQVIFWTNAGILLIRPIGPKFKEIKHAFSFKKIHLTSIQLIRRSGYRSLTTTTATRTSSKVLGTPLQYHVRVTRGSEITGIKLGKTFQWCHWRVTESHTTGKSTVCFTVCSVCSTPFSKTD